MIKSATYLILMLCFATVMQGQSLKFKSDLQDRATGTYSFTSERFTGSFSGSHKQVKLTLKNASDVVVELHENAISLVDISGRGATLCHAALSLQPGEKVVLKLANCEGRQYNEGLFLLDYEYESKAAYKEEAWFLKNKTFVLRVGHDKIRFLTE
jgi:hypothetical protein